MYLPCLTWCHRTKNLCSSSRAIVAARYSTHVLSTTNSHYCKHLKATKFRSQHVQMVELYQVSRGTPGRCTILLQHSASP